MFGFRSVLRSRSAQRVETAAVVPEADPVFETPLVPCNGLRAHWVIAADGKLELRWELDGADSRRHAA